MVWMDWRRCRSGAMAVRVLMDAANLDVIEPRIEDLAPAGGINGGISGGALV
jgi:hypothetical protein